MVAAQATLWILRHSQSFKLEHILSFRNRQFRVKFDERSVRPAETDHVVVVAELDPARDFRFAARDVVLLHNRVVLGELFENHGQKIRRDAVGFRVVAVAAQALDRDHLHWRPAEGRVPLAAGDVRAGLQAAGQFEALEVGDDARRLLRTGDADPERIKGRHERIAPQLLFAKVVVVIKPSFSSHIKRLTSRRRSIARARQTRASRAGPASA